MQYYCSSSNREIWLSNNKQWIIKIPLTGKGESDNWAENRIYKRFSKCPENWFPLAKCKLINDSSILVMEYIKDAFSLGYNYKTLPDWVKYVDCGQVGFTRKNKLVAYDYA